MCNQSPKSIPDNANIYIQIIWQSTNREAAHCWFKVVRGGEKYGPVKMITKKKEKKKADKM